MRPIDADNLKKDLNVEIIFDSRDRYRVRDLIDIQPTIETEPRRTGRWEATSWDNAYFTCSECGSEQKGTPRYCMDCGARMTTRIKYVGLYNKREEPNGTDD